MTSTLLFRRLSFDQKMKQLDTNEGQPNMQKKTEEINLEKFSDKAVKSRKRQSEFADGDEVFPLNSWKSQRRER